MELEYKWKAREETFRAVAASALYRETIVREERLHMEAEYYDTPDRALRQKETALRLRRENGVGMCCLKAGKHVENGCVTRQEWQCEANNLAEGLALLPENGAPAQLCEELAHLPLETVARMDFERLAVTVQTEGMEAELAMDQGTFGGVETFKELELEYKSGSEAAFHAYAEKLAGEFSLEIEPRSKLARALAAADT